MMELSRICNLRRILAALVLLLGAQGMGQAQQQPLVYQNRFYPYWERGATLSQVFYGRPVELLSPSSELQVKWAKRVKPFLDDLINMEPQGRVQFRGPNTQINPAVIRDAEESHEKYWKQHLDHTRLVGDEVQVVLIGKTADWYEVWVRFIEQGTTPGAPRINYAAMLIEPPKDGQPPYLADFKILARVPANQSGERQALTVLGLESWLDRITHPGYH